MVDIASVLSGVAALTDIVKNLSSAERPQVQEQLDKLARQIRWSDWTAARNDWLSNRDRLLREIQKADQEGRQQDKLTLAGELQRLDTVERQAAGQYFDEDWT